MEIQFEGSHLRNLVSIFIRAPARAFPEQSCNQHFSEQLRGQRRVGWNVRHHAGRFVNHQGLEFKLTVRNQGRELSSWGRRAKGDGCGSLHGSLAATTLSILLPWSYFLFLLRQVSASLVSCYRLRLHLKSGTKMGEWVVSSGAEAKSWLFTAKFPEAKQEGSTGELVVNREVSK